MLRSGGRLDLRSHHRWSPQRDDQGESKEHQSQHGVEGGKEWNVCADGRKDFCLDEVDPPPRARPDVSPETRAAPDTKGRPGEEAEDRERDRT